MAIYTVFRTLSTVAPEVPEHTHLNGSLHRLPMVRCQVGGFTEGDNSVIVLGEHPIEDDEMHRAASISKNLATLHLRMIRHCGNAMRMARMFESLGLTVRYPGLPSHPDHERMDRLRNPGCGFGGMLAVEFPDEATANRVAGRRQEAGVGSVAVSLGFHRTLFTAPATSTSSELPPDERAAMGMSPGLLRISVGLDPDLDPILARMRACLEEDPAVLASGAGRAAR